MRFTRYLNERKGDYMAGITFVDIDETLARTHAKILVKDKETGEVIHELDNQQFNAYKLKDGEEFDFQQFRNAELFRKTSIPINKTVARIRRMIRMIKENQRRSKIIFLTARADFDDKQEFLQWFRDQGIDIDFKSNVYVERSGNMKTGTTEERKKRIVMGYLKEGIYRRVRIIDDYIPNVKKIVDIADDVPQSIIDTVKKNANIPEESDEPIMEFFGLHIDDKGNLSLVEKKEVR